MSDEEIQGEPDDLSEMLDRTNEKDVSRFLLRVNPKIKKVATEFSKLSHLPHPNFLDRPRSRVLALGSINSVFVTFIEIGMEAAIPILESSLSVYKREYEVLSEIMMFFMKDATLEVARPEDFPEGSETREYLDEMYEIAAATSKTPFTMGHQMVAGMLSSKRDLVANTSKALDSLREAFGSH